MNKTLKVIMTISLVIALCLGSVYNSEAAKRIKSKSVSMSVSDVTIGVEDVVSLSAKMKPANSTDSLKWSTSDKEIATVNKYGVVTGKAEGTVTITVKTSSNKKARCKVTVKDYLTKEEITELISADCLEEETIVELIKKNSLSEENVKELIKNNSLSEDVVKKLIVDNSIAEEKIKELIQDNTLSEEMIKKLVRDNMLSEEDVKKIIQENVRFDSTTSSDWEDGTELKLYSKQSFPMKFAEEGVTITNVSIKKYHVDDFVEEEDGEYFSNKYIGKVYFSLDEELIKSDEKSEYLYLMLTFCDNIKRGWCIAEESVAGTAIEAWSVDENGIYFIFEFYSNQDTNEYQIGNMEKSWLSDDV